MVRARVRLVLVLAGLSSAGCGAWLGLPNPQASQAGGDSASSGQSKSDDALFEQYEAALKKSQATPQDMQAAFRVAAQVQLLHDLGVVERKGLDSGKLVNEAEMTVDLALLSNKDDDSQAMGAMAKGGVYLSVGRAAEAVKLLEEAMTLAPKPGVLGSLLAAYDKTSAGKDKIAAACARARPNAADDDALFGLLAGCIERLGRDGLSWPKAKEDLAFYDQESERQAAQAAARRAEEEARREQQRQAAEAQRREQEARARSGSSSSSSFSSGARGGGSSGTAGSPANASYSLSLKNECKETVRLFYGQKPKFGSGTYSSIGANTLQSKSGSVGDMIWIVDKSDNGISSYMPRAGSQNVVITPSCSGFAPR